MLNFNPTSKGITIDKNFIKLHNKNQLFAESVFDDEKQIYDVIWVLEQYEYTEHDGTDMFSVFDGFHLLEDAINIGMRLNDKTRERIVDEILRINEKERAM
jgi:hypothetical protein